MSDTTPATSAVPGSPVPTERDALERDIAQTRERLARTADALAAKADVKGQAQAKVEDLKAGVHDVSDRAPGTPQQQTGLLVGVIVAATALAVYLVVRRR